jgi:transposase
MLRLTLTATQRDGLEALRRDASLTPVERDRVEILLLADHGWSVPEIATHFHCCRQTVRRLLHRFRPDELTSLRRQRPGPPPAAPRRAQVTTALARLLAQDRTWTAKQLATALVDEGIQLSTRQVRRYLRQSDARWRRTARTLRHKQDPVRVAAATDDLRALKKGHKLAS